MRPAGVVAPAARRRTSLGWLGRALLLLALMMPVSVSAHAPSLAYLSLTDTGADDRMRAQWDIALRDLDWWMDFDIDRDGRLRWQELRGRLDEAAALVAPTIEWRAGSQDCTHAIDSVRLIGRDEGVYLRMGADVRCPSGSLPTALRYQLFAQVLPDHRVLIEHAGTVQSWPTDPDTWHSLTPSAGARLAGFIGSGIHHILIGWDHLAFLAALLLAATWMRGPSPAVSTSRSVWAEVAVTLTAFTVAHSLTLALAALGLLNLPAGPVEALIAASIIVAGLLNLPARRLAPPAGLAFAFGLVHGLGFANVMLTSQGGPGAVALGLFGFNLGVEIGQLAFAAVLLPGMLLVLRRPGLARPLGSAASLALAGLGTVWLIERLALLPSP
ncbi:MAG: HupE/UreJ family protein [Burkholderiaceae bacterium]